MGTDPDPVESDLPELAWLCDPGPARPGWGASLSPVMPALELRLGTIPRGPHDAPLLLLNNLIIDPDRNFGPALHLGQEGAQTTGLAPTPQLQERLVARDQMVDLARSQSGRSRRQSALRRSLSPRFVDPPPSSVEIEIVEPDQVKPWLDEVEPKLLPSGTSRKE